MKGVIHKSGERKSCQSVCGVCAHVRCENVDAEDRHVYIYIWKYIYFALRLFASSRRSRRPATPFFEPGVATWPWTVWSPTRRTCCRSEPAPLLGMEPAAPVSSLRPALTVSRATHQFSVTSTQGQCCSFIHNKVHVESAVLKIYISFNTRFKKHWYEIYVVLQR